MIQVVLLAQSAEYLRKSVMRRLKRTGFCLLVMAALFLTPDSRGLYGQSAAPLSIGDLPRLVRERSVAAQDKYWEVLAMELDIKNQPFEFAPDLNLHYAGVLNKLFNEDYYVNHTLSLSSRLSLDDTIFYEQAEDRLRYARLKDEYEILYQQELLSTLILFIEVLKAKSVLALAQTDDEAARLNYELAQSKKNQGLISEIDLINAEAERDNSLYLAEKARLDYDIALTQLKRKLQMESLAIEEQVLLQNTQLGADRLSGFRNTEGNLLSIKIDTLEKGLAQSELRKFIETRNRWLPSLALQLDIGYDQYLYDSRTGDWVDSEDKFDTKLTITATFPVFERNHQTNRLRKSRLAVTKAQRDLQQAQKELAEQVQEFIESHNRSLDLLAVSQKRVTSASREYEKKQESFKLGIANTLAVYEARQKYLNTQKDYLFLQFDILLLKARIGNLLGDTYFLLH